MTDTALLDALRGPLLHAAALVARLLPPSEDRAAQALAAVQEWRLDAQGLHGGLFELGAVETLRELGDGAYRAALELEPQDPPAALAAESAALLTWACSERCPAAARIAQELAQEAQALAALRELPAAVERLHLALGALELPAAVALRQALGKTAAMVARLKLERLKY